MLTTISHLDYIGQSFFSRDFSLFQRKNSNQFTNECRGQCFEIAQIRPVIVARIQTDDCSVLYPHTSFGRAWRHLRNSVKCLEDKNESEKIFVVLLTEFLLTVMKAYLSQRRESWLLGSERSRARERERKN